MDEARSAAYHRLPDPRGVVRNAIRDLGMTRQEFMDIQETM